jgi:hypothetical protein
MVGLNNEINQNQLSLSQFGAFDKYCSSGSEKYAQIDNLRDSSN